MASSRTLSSTIPFLGFRAGNGLQTCTNSFSQLNHHQRSTLGSQSSVFAQFPLFACKSCSLTLPITCSNPAPHHPPFTSLMLTSSLHSANLEKRTKKSKNKPPASIIIFRRAQMHTYWVKLLGGNISGAGFVASVLTCTTLGLLASGERP